MRHGDEAPTACERRRPPAPARGLHERLRHPIRRTRPHRCSRVHLLPPLALALVDLIPPVLVLVTDSRLLAAAPPPAPCLLPHLPDRFLWHVEEGGPARSGGPPSSTGSGVVRDLGPEAGRRPLTSEINEWRSMHGDQQMDINGRRCAAALPVRSRAMRIARARSPTPRSRGASPRMAASSAASSARPSTNFRTPGTDDRDEMGVCIEPEEYVLGLRPFEQGVTDATRGIAERPRDPDSSSTACGSFRWAP
jgi:hypothetical protein